MWLAWRNLNHDRFRFLVTVVGIAFAVFLMIFQGSLLVGFLRASSKSIDMTDGDLWIAARGVESFEFASPLPDRFYEIVSGVNGVDRCIASRSGSRSTRSRRGCSSRCC